MQRVRRGRLSSLDVLPLEAEEDVVWAFGELRRRKLTQDEIRDQLNLRLRLKGIKEISRTAFHRASVRTARMAHRLGEVREIATALASKFEQGGDEDLTLLVSETLKTLVFELLENAGELKATPMAAEMIANLALALKSAEQAKKITAETKRVIEANWAKRADAAIETVGAIKGLTEEMKRALRAELFGKQPILVEPPKLGASLTAQAPPVIDVESGPKRPPDAS